MKQSPSILNITMIVVEMNKRAEYQQELPWITKGWSWKSKQTKEWTNGKKDSKGDTKSLYKYISRK